MAPKTQAKKVLGYRSCYLDQKRSRLPSFEWSLISIGGYQVPVWVVAQPNGTLVMDLHHMLQLSSCGAEAIQCGILSQAVQEFSVG
mmetsp:Transcript_1855/g.4739  ORF Transcript_1855/g.4739 Transcript_1855/m.4739 type:complete len:86 (+) Transcript_1855:241-498(+)